MEYNKQKNKLLVLVVSVLVLGYLQPSFALTTNQKSFLGGFVVAGLGLAGIVSASLSGDDSGDEIYTYEIGEAWPKGTEGASDQVGWVFYCDGAEPCEHGLIAAMVDNIGDPWGCQSTNIGTSSDIWMGKSNTRNILSTCLVRPIAASYCDDYKKGNLTDWFLPSFGELIEMYNNLKDNNIGNFVDDYYWSSTEDGSANAYTINFTDGSVSSSGKSDGTRHVRAAHAF